MAEERKLSVGEVRRTIATSLSTAFGFVIALLWNNVVMGAVGVAGIDLTAQGGWADWTYLVVTAVVLTVVMIILIIMFGRWGGKK